MLLQRLLSSYTSDVQTNCWSGKNLQQLLQIFSFGKITGKRKERRNYGVYKGTKQKLFVVGRFFLFPLRQDSRNKIIQNFQFCPELCTALMGFSHTKKTKEKKKKRKTFEN